MPFSCVSEDSYHVLINKNKYINNIKKPHPPNYFIHIMIDVIIMTVNIGTSMEKSISIHQLSLLSKE